MNYAKFIKLFDTTPRVWLLTYATGNTNSHLVATRPDTCNVNDYTPIREVC